MLGIWGRLKKFKRPEQQDVAEILQNPAGIADIGPEFDNDPALWPDPPTEYLRTFWTANGKFEQNIENRRNFKETEAVFAKRRRALTTSVFYRFELLHFEMKRIKNELRTTMSESRLNALALLAINCDKAWALDFSELIDSFAKQKARKKVLWLTNDNSMKWFFQ